jgi:hypothetical protein
LNDIVDLAIDNKQPLAVLLRNCLVLGRQLKNDPLKAWANQELNGYSTWEGIPEYRIVHVGASGNFFGAFGAALRNYPIPPIGLDEEHRHFAESVHLMEGVGSYEHMLKDYGSIKYPWPGNLVVYYQQRLYRPYVLVNAWQEVPKSAVAELLDTIRTRTLNMALEIKSEVGVVEDLTKIGPAEIAQVERSITNNIYGTTIIAGGYAQVNANVTATQNTINVGDRAQLEAFLKQSGLSDTDIKELSEAEAADEKKMGTRVMEWIKTNASKAVVGGVKLGADITKEILTTYLKQYFGLGK